MNDVRGGVLDRAVPAAVTAAKPAAAADAHEPFPLTDVQQAYLLGRADDFDLSGVATHAYLEIAGRDLDPQRLIDAWNAVVAHNGMLRAVFGPDDVQRILPEVPRYELTGYDARGADPTLVKAHLERVREEMAHQVMPPDRWPLFDVRVSLLPHGAVTLHLSIDNLIADGASIRLLLKEWEQRYFEPGSAAPPQEFTFRDYVLAARELEHTPKYAKARAYWLDRVAQLPPGPALPLAMAPDELTEPRFEMLSRVLDEPAWARLRRRAANARVSASTVLLAAYTEVLGAWSRSRHFTVTMTVFNKQPLHERVDEVVGDFTSINLLEVDLRAPASFTERVRALQAQVWRDLDHGMFNGVRVLREWARSHHGAAASPMPVVFTSTLGSVADGVTFERLGELVTAASQTPQVWLDNMLVQRPDGIALIWNAVTDLFPPGVPAEMFDAYTTLVYRLAGEGPDAEEAWTETHRDLRPAEHRHEHEAANDTTADLPGMAPLHLMVRTRCAMQPHAPAVIAVDRTLSYGELAGYADAVTARLHQLGARRGDLVAVLMRKGWQQIAAVLGILQAGCAYLPVSAQLPAARRELLLQDGNVRATLIRAADADLCTDNAGPVVVVDDLDPTTGGYPASTETVTIVGVRDLAYVLYTSGSTGRPKGVMMEHRGAATTVLDVNRRIGLGPADRALAVSELNFDLSVYDVFGTLSAGAALVIPDPERGPDPAHWAELVDRHGVTVWNSVPALAQLLVEEAGRNPAVSLTSLRHVLLSGDWIPVTLPERVTAVCPARVTSLGGPTEAAIWQVQHPVDRVDPAWPSIPYGTPLTNHHVYVLDECLQQRPTWVPGQLCIGGDGLARGYWADPERTAERFVTHPVTGERLYLSGDVGRYRPGGVLEFLGREDLQVKIHGHRIELGEIEAILLRHPGVREAAVVAPVLDGRPRLTAYVAGEGCDPDRLRAHLAEQLPEYMVPTAFVVLDALPLSANGKVDRARLPRPATSTSSGGGGGGGGGALRTDIERTIAGAWREAFEVDEVTREDSFFSLGGDSLVATRLVGRLREALGVDLRLRELLQAGTLADLAELVERRRGGAPVAADGPGDRVEAAPAPIEPRPQMWAEPYPLTDIQRAFLRERAEGGGFLTGLTDHAYTEIAGHDLDVDRLADAWHAVVSRHGALRTVFGPGQIQRVLPEVPRYQIKVYDLRAGHRSGRARPERRRLPAWILGAFEVAGDGHLTGDAVAHLESVREEMTALECAPERWPLFDLRATLLPAGEVRLHVAVDGLLSDGTGLRRILREWARAYHRPGAPLSTLDIALRDYVLGVRDLESTEAYGRASAYWLDRIDRLPAGPQLPAPDAPDAAPDAAAGDGPSGAPPVVASTGFALLSRALDAETWARLRKHAARARASAPSVLIAAFAEILASCSGSRHFTMPLTAFNRLPLHPQMGELVGPFTSISLLELDLRGRSTFGDRARDVQERLAADLDHAAFSGIRVLEEWHRRHPAAPTTGPAPLPAPLPVAFTSTLGVDAAEDAGFEGLGELADSSGRTPNVWLNFTVIERGGCPVLIWNVALDRIAAGTAERMLDAYLHLLDRLADDEGAWSAPLTVPETIAAPEPLVLPEPLPERVSGTGGHVLLTGATGFFGGYLLGELLRRVPGTIHCLVRGDDPRAARDRLMAALGACGRWRADAADRVDVVLGDLGEPDLGLGPDGFARLAATVDSIYHNGARVELLLPYEELARANVGGTRELIRLAATVRSKPLHFISTAGRPNAGVGHGYAVSKWHAEGLVWQARTAGLPAAIYRLPRLAADSRTGYANERDIVFWTLRQLAAAGVAPDLDLPEETWLPVDEAARLLVERAVSGEEYGLFQVGAPASVSLGAVVELARADGLFEVLPAAEWSRVMAERRPTEYELIRSFYESGRAPLTQPRLDAAAYGAPPARLFTPLVGAGVDATLIRRHLATLDRPRA
jgi:nonribosomal peptide synthetase protein BlmIV